MIMMITLNAIARTHNPFSDDDQDDRDVHCDDDHDDQENEYDYDDYSQRYCAHSQPFLILDDHDDCDDHHDDTDDDADDHDDHDNQY